MVVFRIADPGPEQASEPLGARIISLRRAGPKNQAKLKFLLTNY